MSRKVILFGPLPPPFGGVAIYIRALTEHFKNVRVWSYTAAPERNKRIRFIAHRRLGTVPALIQEARGSIILDATHFHLEYPHPALLAAWLLAKKMIGFKWYKNIHDGSLPKRYLHFNGFSRGLFRHAVNAVDEFVVVSKELHDWLRDEIKVNQPIKIIPALVPPVNTGYGLSNHVAELIEPYLAHAKRVCSIGVFHPTYGFADVARAVEKLRETTNEDIGLILVDGSFVRDERYRATVLSQRDWITVVENVPNAETFGILKRSDAFVRAFADESYGISRVEAIWSGVPVVATRVGETRGMLTYDFGNVAELVTQLQKALFNPSLAEIEVWAETYRVEAAGNLHAVAQVLGLENEPRKDTK